MNLPFNVWNHFFPDVKYARPSGGSHRLHKSKEVECLSVLTNRLPSLVNIIKHKPGPQMCYQIAFCLWLLTFEQEIAEEINKSVFGILAYLSRLMPMMIGNMT